MEKSDIIEFFNRCAPNWDAEMVKNDEIIRKILNNAQVRENMDILDVACGTGVMIPYYLERKVSSVTGIDISPEMAKIASQKYAAENRVRIICGDVESVEFDTVFDAVIVYNAFPHFPEPKNLIEKLASLVKENGRLTIAHGASRENIDRHHKEAAGKVSNGLMSADRLKTLFEPYFEVEVIISDEQMYQVAGVKRKK